MKTLLKVVVLFIVLFEVAFAKPKLLFYCGITMVKPMKKIAKIIEKKHNCEIKIVQGGSQDLYDSLKFSKKGDLYLPGSDSYIKKNKKDGFFERSEYVGYNQAAIFVQKQNRKKIKNLDDFLRKDLAVILCDPDTGSIGKMTKKILIKYKGDDFFDEVYDNAAELTTDSRGINNKIKLKEADISINWKATSFWDENSEYIDIVNIDEKYAPKKKLMLTLLSFSKNKTIANAFINFAISKDGKKIMKEYGFRD